MMGNGIANDLPAGIPSWKFPDEKHEFNKQQPYKCEDYCMVLIDNFWCWRDSGIIKP